MLLQVRGRSRFPIWSLLFNATPTQMTFISGSGLSSELQIQIPITLWTEAVADFIFLGSKITVDGYCSQEIKRCLLLGRKAMTNLNSVLKNRDITLPTKVHVVKAMVSPVVMYGYESWRIKNAVHQRTDAFVLWCWRRLLSPLDSKIKQVNPKGNQP